MGFGFVVVKFSLFIRQLSLAFGAKVLIVSKTGSPAIGLCLVIIGAIICLLAFIRYRSIEKHLINGTYFPSFILSLLLTIAILLISIVLIFLLLPGL